MKFISWVFGQSVVVVSTISSQIVIENPYMVSSNGNEFGRSDIKSDVNSQLNGKL